MFELIYTNGHSPRLVGRHEVPPSELEGRNPLF